MNRNTTDLRGRRYVCLVRCSTTQQSDTSIPDQLKVLRAFGEENQMVHVDDVVLSGVTGSIPGARTDIGQIILRKELKNDFDVLLVQDLSRFTRGGAEHGMKLEYDLNAAGIDVIFVADHLPEGDHSGIIKSVGFYAARQYAKSLSFATTRGAMSSLEDGRTAHCMRVPYGIDRLYVGTDGKLHHIIRNLADGTQVQLHPETGIVLATFAADKQGGRSTHYRLQANERVTLIPGAPDRVETVRRMFRRRLIDGWAGYRIAAELNEMGVLSGIGQAWRVSSVNQILRNPVFTGTGIANRYTSAIYNIRSKNSPKPSLLDRKALASQRKPSVTTRPRSEWMEIEHPALKDYLGDLRELAVARQKKELAKQASGHICKPASKDRHINSPYLLKGIARSKQGNHPLTGRTVGNARKRTRYYSVNRGFTVPGKDATLRRLIPAIPLEKAVLEIVRQVLGSIPQFRERLIQQIEKQRRQSAADGIDLKKLTAEQQKIQTQLEVAIDSLGTLGREAARSKLQKLEARLGELSDQIARATAGAPVKSRDADAVADEIIGRLARIGSELDQLPPQAVRGLLHTLIAKLEVDLNTRAIAIELALPDWATNADFGKKNGMCLEDSSACGSGHQAHGVYALILGYYDCQWEKRGTCPVCQRKAA